jgi:CheY-like chemotaxis protein
METFPFPDPSAAPAIESHTGRSLDSPSLLDSSAGAPAAVPPSPEYAADAVPSASRIRLIVADEQALVREGVVRLCGDHADLSVIAEAADGHTAVGLAEALRPDVLVMDVNLPLMNGLEATTLLKQRAPGVKVLALSRHREDVYVREF